MIDGQAIDAVTLPTGYVLASRYEIQRSLGRGAMGTVYLAHDRLLSWQPVAIKVLHRELSGNERVMKRFLREVQLMHMVNHPSVVRTYDAGVHNEVVYYTMEYVPGVTLDETGYAGAIDYAQIGRLTIEICEGLAAIHSAKIIHRDLKPGNIMLLDGDRVKIADFGVARPISSEITQHKEIVGSINYMPPEILQGQELMPAVDFYSLGAILFELVSGRLPFESDHAVSLMWMHINKPPEPVVRYAPETPAWLNDLILCMLSKTPANRPGSAEEIIDYIRKYQSSPSSGRLPAFTPASELVDGEALPAEGPQTAAPPESGEEQPFGDGQSAEAAMNLRSANSGIIFRNMPTKEEIEQHEQTAILRRKFDLKSHGPLLAEDEGVAREWRRVYFSTALLLLILLIATPFVLYYAYSLRQSQTPYQELRQTAALTPVQQPPRPAAVSKNHMVPIARVSDEFPLLQLMLHSVRSHRQPQGAAKTPLDAQTAAEGAEKLAADMDSWYLNLARSKSAEPREGARVGLDNLPLSSVAPDDSPLRKPAPFSLAALSGQAALPALDTRGYFGKPDLASLLNLDLERNIHGSYIEAANIEEELRAAGKQIDVLTLTSLEEVQKKRDAIIEERKLAEELKKKLLGGLPEYRRAYEFWLFRGSSLKKKQFNEVAHQLAQWYPAVKEKKSAYDKAYSAYHSIATGVPVERKVKEGPGSRTLENGISHQKAELEDILFATVAQNIDITRAALVEISFALAKIERLDSRLALQLQELDKNGQLSPSERRTAMDQLRNLQRDLNRRLGELSEVVADEQVVVLEKLQAFSLSFNIKVP